MSNTTTITKDNIQNWQMGDIRSLMSVYGVSEEEAFNAYNNAQNKPFDKSVFEEFDNL